MSSEEVREIKAYVKAVVGGHVVADNMGYCVKCGEWRDLRMGHCFECVFDECPVEKCAHLNYVYNVKRERVWKDSKFKTSDGKVYCNCKEGLCDEAVTILETKLRMSEK